MEQFEVGQIIIVSPSDGPAKGHRLPMKVVELVGRPELERLNLSCQHPDYHSTVSLYGLEDVLKHMVQPTREEEVLFNAVYVDYVLR